MDLVDGKEVLDTIAEQPSGCYTEDDAKNLFRQIIEGIAYLHQQNVVHRDIKPQNLLVTAENKLFIMDFNVSFKNTSDE